MSLPAVKMGFLSSDANTTPETFGSDSSAVRFSLSAVQSSRVMELTGSEPSHRIAYRLPPARGSVRVSTRTPGWKRGADARGIVHVTTESREGSYETADTAEEYAASYRWTTDATIVAPRGRVWRVASRERRSVHPRRRPS